VDLFRYLLSIFANLAMTVLGGFLSYSGGVALFLTLQIYLFLETELSDGRTMNETLGAMNGGQMDMFGDATPWLIIGGELLFGLPLLFFGLRGLLHRLRDGLPDEDEGVAETPAGRIAQVLVYMAGCGVGLFLLGALLLDIFGYMSMVAQSDRAEAIIEKTWRSDGVGDEIAGRYYARYRFNTREGASVTAETAVPAGAGKEFAEGHRIVVSYLPGDPSVNEWEELRSLSDYVLRLVLYGAMVVGGLWGVQRNLLGDAEPA